ncbi:MAG TPA: DUF2480 family protein [Flavitalea sp.]|nr:DUF2480 family protein [Flavitalea sp.]
MADEIINKVSLSPLVSIDLENYYPKEEFEVFDLKPFLFMELILKEKDFRAALQQTNWLNYENKIVAVMCSTDAIIPVWAYMLVASYLAPIAREVFFGTLDEAKSNAFMNNIRLLSVDEYIDKRVVVKGCGDIEIGPEAYLEITKKLRPVVKSIMYGEPCSTVPVFKKK